jgi:hemoglobin
MRAVVNDFVDRALCDPAVNYTRGGAYPMNAEALARTKGGAFEFLSDVLGGPTPYGGRTLKEIHAPMEITDSEFDAFVEHFELALERHGVGPALIAQLMDAVRSVRRMIVSPNTSRVAVPPGHTIPAEIPAATASSARQTDRGRPCR